MDIDAYIVAVRESERRALAPMIRDLRHLARAEARRRHLACADIEGRGAIDGHVGLFRDCPHEDCQVIRQAGALLIRQAGENE